MSKKETNKQAIEAIENEQGTMEGAFVTQEGKDGAFVVTGHSRGWYTLEDEAGNQHKARAGSLVVVSHEDGDEAADEAEASRKMSATLDRYKAGYKETVAYSGSKSQNNGDTVAQFLAGLAPEDVMRIAERLLEMEAGTLVAKYEGLNPGQKRMNSGNRIRAAVKRGDATIDDVKAAYQH